MIRQILGMIIGTGGVFLLTRTLGPTAYGTYVAVFGISSFAVGICSLGITVYLVRKEETPSPDLYNTAFTFLMVTGSVVAMLMIAAIPYLSAWMNVEEANAKSMAIALFCLIPIHLAGVVPLAIIERELDFGRVAVIELIAQILLYAVALPAAFAGFGSWAPAAGWIALRVFSTVAVLVISKYRPRFCWNVGMIREMLEYGISYSASNWIWGMRNLINPLIVARFAGLDTVAYINLAIRFVTILSFVKNAIWRVSIAAFGKFQNDKKRLANAIKEGTEYQTLLLGPIYVVFTLIGPFLIDFVYAGKWLEVMSIFPFIAAGFLANAAFSLHSSALYVLRHNISVGIFHAIHVAVFAGTVLILIPSMGIVAYGIGELVAIVSYATIYLFVRKYIAPINQTTAMLLAAAFGFALFWTHLGWVAFLGIGIAFVYPPVWISARNLITNVRQIVSP